MSLFLAAILSFSFTLPDSNMANGTCLKPVSVASSGDSVFAEWRAQPLFASGGYMRTQSALINDARGKHWQIFVHCGVDSATSWQITVKTGRWGLLNGERIRVWNPCPRSITKYPTR